MKQLKISGLSKSFFGSGKGRMRATEIVGAVDEVNLLVDEGMLCALVGESGCGKTTLLRMIAGLEQPDAGQIIIGEEVVSEQSRSVPPEKRSVGLVFQEAALFPHLSVEENVCFGLSKLSKAERKERCTQLLKLVGLEGFSARRPGELSGGEAQRVALARALAPQPDLLLLDEPFSNLDPSLRVRLRDDLREILRSTNTTALFVTHDSQDAMAIADRVAVMRQGKILQVGEPAKVYRNPYDAYCGQLFGPINRVPSQWVDKQGPALQSEKERADSFLWMRPEDFEVLAQSEDDWCVKVDVTDITYQGEHQQLRVHCDELHGTHPELTVRLDSEQKIFSGQSVWLRPKSREKGK